MCNFSPLVLRNDTASFLSHKCAVAGLVDNPREMCRECGFCTRLCRLVRSCRGTAEAIERCTAVLHRQIALCGDSVVNKTPWVLGLCLSDQCCYADPEIGCAGSKHCWAHGGGRRCQHDGCTKSTAGSSNLCVAHGGGRAVSMNDGKPDQQHPPVCPSLCFAVGICLLRFFFRSAVGSS